MRGKSETRCLRQLFYSPVGVILTTNFGADPNLFCKVPGGTHQHTRGRQEPAGRRPVAPAGRTSLNAFRRVYLGTSTFFMHLHIPVLSPAHSWSRPAVGWRRQLCAVHGYLSKAMCIQVPAPGTRLAYTSGPGLRLLGGI